MVSALDFGPSGLGSSPGRGHCVVFLGKILNSQIGELSGKPDKNGGGYPAMDLHPIQGIPVPSRFMLWKPELCAGLISHNACTQI